MMHCALLKRRPRRKKRRDSTLFDVGAGLNLDTFIELLNILDEVLLADTSMADIRRGWVPDEPIGHEYIVRELLMWCCLFSRFDLIDEIFEHETEQTGIGVMLGTAYLITNCNTVTSKYVTLTELKNSYQEKREKN